MLATFTRLCSFFLLLALPALAGPPTTPTAPPAAATIEFVANRQQWEPAVLFAANVPSGRLFLERGRLVQARYDGRRVSELRHRRTRKELEKAMVPAHAYATTFVGANLQATVVGEAQLPGYSSYFLGNNKSRWASEVPGYEGVRYRGLYPGIDLRFYSKNQALEYDFEVEAGADAQRIALRYAGQSQLRVVEGALHIGTSVGTVVEQQPYAYQVVRGQRRPVPCAYVLGAHNTVTFSLPQGYDHALPLVIDPVLVYATFTGSLAENWGCTATYDLTGNLLSGGIVFNTGYPITLGAYDTSYNGSVDIGLIKYNPNSPTGPGSRVWATYVGGASDDEVQSLVVDQQNNLLLMGVSSSLNYPTTPGAFRTAPAGLLDIVLSKLSPSGGQLLASTYLGGSGYDGQLTSGQLMVNYGDFSRSDLTVDRDNNIYLASVTTSANFPTTAAAFQPGSGGGLTDGVVSKLNPTLTTLLWSSYLGGSGTDAAYSIQVDSLNNVFVGGGTNSANLPGTAGAYRSTNQGGVDGFITRILPTGSGLARTTYLGTSAYDQAYLIQLDKQGAVYAFGQTAGSYPVSAGVYANPGSRQFIHKLNATLTTSIFSTVIGNGATASPCMSPTAFLVNNCGQIVLSGWTLQSGLPVTADAVQATGGSGTTKTTLGYDGWFYVAQLSPNARSLTYGTYYGNGTCHVDGGTSRFDKQGNVYQAICGTGSTATAPTITTPNAWAAAPLIGLYNNAAFKLDVGHYDANFVISNAPQGPRVYTGCAPARFYFSRAGSGGQTTWSFGNGQTATATNSPSALYATPGTYVVRLTVTDSTSCGTTATQVDTVKVYGLPSAAVGPDQTICPGGRATLTVASAGPGATYAWSPATGLSATTGPTVQASPTTTTQYTVRATTATGCTSTATVQVLVATAPRLSVVAVPTTTSAGVPIAFTSAVQSLVTGYSWNFGDGQSSTAASPAHTYAKPGSYQVQLTATYGPNCTETFVLPMVIQQADLPNIITPNADGLNDTFRPVVSQSKLKLQIFNRWGKQVYEKQDYTDGWGPEATPGVYYYHLLSATGESWRGWLEVVK